MYKSIYFVKDMDCPSEKAIIEMKLSEFDNIIKKINFNINNRIVEIYHTEENKEIVKKMKELNLGSELKETKKVYNINFKEEKEQKNILIKIFLINFLLFIVEITTGIISNSMGLIADSLDMLSDASIYLISLFAIGTTIAIKKKIAKIAGYIQLTLALIGIFEVIRRFIFPQEEVNFIFMIGIASLAFLGNLYAMILFNKTQSKEAHIKASQICTSNDLIANIGVIISGILVYILGSNIPDLIIGLIVFIIVLNGAIKMIKLGK